MGRPALFNQKTIEELLDYRKSGFTFREMAEITGHNEKSIKNWFYRNYSLDERKEMVKLSPRLSNHVIKKGNKTETPVEQIVNEMIQSSQIKPVQPQQKEKTLKDFQARDMIKYLYDLGYRIEDNKLVCYVKQTVNVKDIINA